MRIRVVPVAVGEFRIIVSVICITRHDLLDHVPDVGQQRVLPFVDKNTCRRMQRGNLNVAVPDRSRLGELSKLFGQIHELGSLVCLDRNRLRESPDCPLIRVTVKRGRPTLVGFESFHPVSPSNLISIFSAFDVAFCPESTAESEAGLYYSKS